MAERVNPRCPDYTSHSENAVDRVRGGRALSDLTIDEWVLVDAMAEDEYWACEGH